MSKDIKIREVSNAVIAAIDEKASYVGKSRNEFLRDYLENEFIFSSKLDKIDAKYEQLLSRSIKIIEFNSLLLKTVADELLINIDDLIRGEENGKD